MGASLSGLTLSYAGFYGLRFEEFVAEASKFGFQKVQFIPDQAPNLYSQISAARRVELARMLKDMGMTASFHSVFYDLNIVSLVPSVQHFSLEVTGAVMELASSVGARFVTVHPGYMFPGWRASTRQSENFWAAAKEGMQALEMLANSKNIVACIENGSYYVSSRVSDKRTPLHIGVNVHEMEQLLGGTGGQLGVCLDIGKVLASEDSLESYLNAFIDRVAQIQVGGPKTLAIALEIAHRIRSNFGRDVEIVYEGSAENIPQLIDSLAS